MKLQILRMVHPLQLFHTGNTSEIRAGSEGQDAAEAEPAGQSSEVKAATAKTATATFLRGRPVGKQTTKQQLLQL